MSAALNAYRLYFQVTGAILPGLAARSAHSLFLTPLPRRGPSRWPDELQEHVRPFPLTFKGQSLEGWRFGEGDNKILLCHGWGECAARLARFIPPLLRAGYCVVTFDGPAHGRSVAKRTNLGEFTALLRQLQTEQGPFHAALGHSFGAASIVYGLHTSLQFTRVVLVAPFGSSDNNFDRFAETLRLPGGVRRRAHARLLDFFADEIDGWDLAPIAQDFSTPALLVHDRNDPRIPFSESERLSAAWPGAELVATEGLGHSKILRDPTTVERATEFLTA